MNLKEIHVRVAFGSKARANFYETLKSFVNDGVPLYEAVEEIHDLYVASRSPKALVTSRILANARGAKGKVQGLAESMEWCATSAEQLALQAGAQSGNIALGLETAANVATKNADLVKAIMGKIVGPVFLIIATIGLLIFVRTTTIPIFESVLPRGRWPTIPAALGRITDLVPVVIPVGAIVVGLYFWAFTITAGRWKPSRTRALFDKYMFPYNIYSTANLAITLSAVSALVSAKVAFATAIDQISFVSSPWVRAQLEKVARSMRSGEKEGIALSRLFEGDVRWEIAAYGKRSNFGAALSSLSNRINDKMLTKITWQFAIVRFAMQLTVAIVLLLVMASFSQITMSIRG